METIKYITTQEACKKYDVTPQYLRRRIKDTKTEKSENNKWINWWSIEELEEFAKTDAYAEYIEKRKHKRAVEEHVWRYNHDDEYRKEVDAKIKAEEEAKHKAYQDALQYGMTEINRIKEDFAKNGIELDDKEASEIFANRVFRTAEAYFKVNYKDAYTKTQLIKELHFSNKLVDELLPNPYKQCTPYCITYYYKKEDVEKAMQTQAYKDRLERVEEYKSKYKR